MRYLIKRLPSVLWALLLVSMLFVTVYRLLGHSEYDPLLPLAMILMIMMLSAIYNLMSGELLEIKLAALAFLQQSREQTQFLSAGSNANDLVERVEKLTHETEQKPDLN